MSSKDTLTEFDLVWYVSIILVHLYILILMCIDFTSCVTHFHDFQLIKMSFCISSVDSLIKIFIHIDLSINIYVPIRISIKMSLSNSLILLTACDTSILIFSRLLFHIHPFNMSLCIEKELRNNVLQPFYSYIYIWIIGLSDFTITSSTIILCLTIYQFGDVNSNMGQVACSL